jgi:hypothetical protein
MQIIHTRHTIPQSSPLQTGSQRNQTLIFQCQLTFSTFRTGNHRNGGHERKDSSGFMEEETQLRPSSCREGTITEKK